jgi:hypothetical protein
VTQSIPLDERALARKYGVRELVWPDVEQIKALTQFLGVAVDNGRVGAVPKMAVVVMLEFLQGVINRQHITKAPHMPAEEFDALSNPYYVAARIVTKLAREKSDLRGKVYETTWITLSRFIEVLRNLLDPACQWIRFKTLPDDVRDVLEVLQRFAEAYPEQRKKGRAV